MSWTAASRSPAAARCCAAVTSGFARRPECRCTSRTARSTPWRSAQASAWRTSTPCARCSFPTEGSKPREVTSPRGWRGDSLAHVRRSASDGSCALLESRRTRVVLAVLLVAAIALITIDFRDGGNSGAHGIGGRLFGPVERVTGDVTGFFRGAASGGEVANLQKQNDQLRAELAQAQTSNANAGQLARLLHLTGGRYQVVTGTVIAAGGEYADTVTINVGSAAGVAVNE